MFTEMEERQIDNMMAAIFNERCPGIGFHPNDREPYRNAAIAALQSLGVLSDASANGPPQGRPAPQKSRPFGGRYGDSPNPF